MISSEVQRTLVKSPPELWAELSDPAALARHLGELGEIRITRIEPEQLVEWEAENRTGTVQIKPSGWGTKVTLTVATEVPETSPAEEPAAPNATEPAGFDATEPAAFDATEPEDEPAALGEDEPAAFVAGEPAALTDDERTSPAEVQPAAPEERVPSRLGAPLTAAAASSWRADTERAEAEDQSPGWIAEDADELPPGEAANEEVGETYEWTPYDELEPRRGFLARLFGRWRKPPAAGSAVEEESLSPETGVATDPAAAPATPGAPIEMAPPEEPAVDELESVEAPPVPVADGAAEEPEAISPGPAPAEQVVDIAAELKAAEETEDAEVTAVLTSVLDRLGAAHHRPFSRS